MIALCGYHYYISRTIILLILMLSRYMLHAVAEAHAQNISVRARYGAARHVASAVRTVCERSIHHWRSVARLQRRAKRKVRRRLRERARAGRQAQPNHTSPFRTRVRTSSRVRHSAAASQARTSSSAVAKEQVNCASDAGGSADIHSEQCAERLFVTFYPARNMHAACLQHAAPRHACASFSRFAGVLCPTVFDLKIILRRRLFMA